MQHTYTPKVGKCGFRNIGNTCYMNSVLQLLMHCKPLVSFLIKKESDNGEISEYKNYHIQASIESVASKKRRELKLTSDEKVSISKNDINRELKTSITVELAKIVDVMKEKGSSVITPATLKKVIDEKLSFFKDLIQHDAHEFLIMMLDTIIEETGIESSPTLANIPISMKNCLKKIELYENQLKDALSLHEKKMIIEKINETKQENIKDVTRYNGLKYMMQEYEKKYNPFIHQLQYVIMQTIKCVNCNYISSTYQKNECIQIEVKDTLLEGFDELIKMEDDVIYKCPICTSWCEKNPNRNISDKVKPEDCPDKCEICYKKVVATRSDKLWRLPTILFIHLKRFYQLPNGMYVKNNKNVEIPTNIDLSPYFDEYMECEKPIPKMYKLKGFINHMGSMNGGHYTADNVCIVDDETWYHFDDSNIYQNINGILDTRNAYILMYELEL